MHNTLSHKYDVSYPSSLTGFPFPPTLPAPQGVVVKVDKNAQQLKEAIEDGAGIIITTLQKFPVIYNQVHSGNKRFAVLTGFPFPPTLPAPLLPWLNGRKYVFVPSSRVKNDISTISPIRCCYRIVR